MVLKSILRGPRLQGFMSKEGRMGGAEDIWAPTRIPGRSEISKSLCSSPLTPVDWSLEASANIYQAIIILHIFSYLLQRGTV